MIKKTTALLGSISFAFCLGLNPSSPIYFKQNDKVKEQTISLTNGHDVPASIKLEKWTQENGKEILNDRDKADGLSCTIDGVEIKEPVKNNVQIKVAFNGEQGDVERAYQLVADTASQKTANQSNLKLNVIFKSIVNCFVSPKEVDNKPPTWKIEEDNIVINNTGNVHVVLTNIMSGDKKTYSPATILAKSTLKVPFDKANGNPNKLIFKDIDGKEFEVNAQEQSEKQK